MGAKVSANESSVENVSIKYRPMKIAEDYTQLQSEEWFLALECVKEKKPGISEEDCLGLLCNIIKVYSYFM